MDETSFFKGVEVGRALRGWRMPDEPSVPSGTYSISKNGEYDVSRYAEAKVNVTSLDKVSAAQLRAMFNGSKFYLPTFAVKTFSMYMEFVGVTEDSRGYPKEALWRLHFQGSCDGGAQYGKAAGFALWSDATAIPSSRSILKPVVASIFTKFIGFHELTMVEGPIDKECVIHAFGLSGGAFESVSYGLDDTLHIDGDIAIALEYANSGGIYGNPEDGTGWDFYSGNWHGYMDITYSL